MSAILGGEGHQPPRYFLEAEIIFNGQFTLEV
jgi:hypothetical protein